jgi:PLP dependent protein
LTPADIKSNLEVVHRRIAQACIRSGRSTRDVILIAVTKTEDVKTIQTAFDLGIRNFGESRVQEAKRKIKFLSGLKPRATWHMIGHLQSNKVNPAMEIFDIIQSIDSLILAKAVNSRAVRKMPVFLEVNVSGEASKKGFSITDVSRSFGAISKLPNLEVRGLMTIAPQVEKAEESRPLFRKLREIRDSFDLEHLSMGMTDDFEVAIEEGATMVRIGRALFGERPTGGCL